MKKKTLLLGLVLLTACQSVADYDKFLQSWVGRSEADLVATWGAPAFMENITTDRQIFVYIKQKTIVMPDEDPNYALLGGDSIYISSNAGMEQAYDYYCQTIFTTTNDIITGYSWEGDGCTMF